MSDGVSVVPLRNAIDLRSGGTPSTTRPELWGGDIPWVSAKDMKRFRLSQTEDKLTRLAMDEGAKIVPTGSCLLLTRGMTLLNDVPICVVQTPVAFNQDVKAVIPKEGVRADFVPYLLLGNKTRLLSLVDLAGHGTGRLNSPDILGLSIVLPSASEQRAIAHILGTLDDKIELNRRTSETLGAMARSLFKSWFIDFYPIAQKNRDIRRKGESLPGLPAHLYDLFPERLVESELGEIPEGWKWVEASELVEFNPPEPLRKGTVAPYLDMAALPTSGSWPDAAIDREFGSGMRFRNGDTLLARITPCLENGKTAFVQSIPDGVVAWGSTEFIVMRSRAPVPPSYSYLLARSPAFREHTVRSMTGTSGRQRAQADAVASFRVASPNSDAVWSAFGDFVEPLFKQIREVSIESESLAKLRDTLLPKLISGELRVNDAERFAEGVVSGFGRQSAC